MYNGSRYTYCTLYLLDFISFAVGQSVISDICHTIHLKPTYRSLEFSYNTQTYLYVVSLRLG